MIDARNNNVSIFQLIEQLNAASFPVAIPRIICFALLKREAADPSNLQLQLEVQSGDQQIFATPVAANFVQQLQTKAFMEMHGLVVPAPGLLRFLLRHEQNLIGSWEVVVNQAGPPQAVQMFFPNQPARHDN